MRITGAERVDDFGRHHADAAPALASWFETVEGVVWRTPADVRATYRTVDTAVPVASGTKVAVFNIKGSRCRLVARLDFGLEALHVLRVMTHAEYSRGKWKDTL